jgi:hypothetical protein
MYDLCRRELRYHGLYSVVLGYVRWVRRKILNLWSLLGDTTFCMAVEILDVEDRTKSI